MRETDRNHTRCPTAKRLTALALATTLAFSSVTAHADLQGTMNSTFNSMVNVTDPGAYEGARRGVIYGGNVSVRNQMMNPKLISVSMPSLRAGCGGIDMYLGSLSYINADQFVNGLKNIASNAGGIVAGYAFKMAIQQMSPTVGAELESLMKRVEEMNKMFRNSCKSARQIVNWGSTELGLSGLAEFSATKKTTSSKDYNTAQAEDPDPSNTVDKENEGNLVWEAINESDVMGWLTSGFFGDTGLKEAMMSLTGTVIVKIGPSKDDSSKKTYNKQVISGVLSIEQLMDGGDVPIIKCGGTECIEPTVGTTEITGMKQKVWEMLFVDDGGIIEGFRSTGNQFTGPQKSFLGAIAPNVGGLLRQLSRDQGAVKAFADQYTNVIAQVATHRMARDLIEAVSVSVESRNDPAAGDVRKLITEARRKLDEGWKKVAEDGKSVNTMLAYYGELKNQLASANATPGAR